ncbi:hypothetical protein [Bacillus solitudinis]|uniref:hypothetical protein n=1 Tax=Bacillus solitudinis TaxID=2014074 RepID=UPI000C23D73E|nr:hypothetical protein [Bacillus solitudinis]
MWKFTVMLFLLLIGGIGGIDIVSLFEGNEVFTGYVAGFAAMVGMIVVLLMFIVAQLHNIESKKD